MTDALLTDTLWRMMLRFIGRRPLQTILFVSGVALGVAMMVAIDLANSSAARAFDLFTESVTGRTTHQITGGPGGVPQELYRQLRVEMGIRNTAPTVSAYVQALELDNQPLRVFGIDAFAEAPFRGYVNVGAQQNDTTVGDITRFFTDPNTALMAEELAARYGIEAGDTITVRYGTQRHTVTVVGLLRPTDAVTQEGLQELLITDVSTAQELLGMVGTLTTIDVIIPEGDTATLQRIRSVLPEGVIIQEAGARTGAVSQMTDAFELSLTALSLLALVVGMFLIYNTVTFSVVQRRPVIGTLRALGVTRQQVFGMILWEAALLSAIGAAIGLALGIVMGRGAVVLVTQTVSSLYFTLNVRGVDVSVESLIRGALIGVGAALLAAVIPALEATTTPPTGALKRSDIESKVRRAIPALTAFGAMLLIGAVILFAGRELVFNFTGLFAIVVGFALFTPLLALLLMSLLRPILGRILGILGLIAPRSIVRSLSRTSVAVAALMVAVSVIVGVSAMVGSFRNNVQDWLSNTAQADIYITPPMITANRQDVPVDPSVQDEVGATAGVARTAMARHIDVIRKDDPLPVYLTAVDYDISEGQRRFVWSIGDFDTTWNALVNGGVILSETFARARNIPIGDGQTVTLITDNGERTYPVIGVMYDYSGTQGTLMMFEDVYRRDFNDEAISSDPIDTGAA
jgi:putative ABC transport system permease protein